MKAECHVIPVNLLTSAETISSELPPKGKKKKQNGEKKLQSSVLTSDSISSD